MTKHKFASALYAARIKYNLTQENAAEVFDISTRWSQKIAKGTSEPNLELICKIAKKFDLNFADFAEGEEENDNIPNSKRRSS